MKKNICLLITILLFSSCSKIDKMLLAWKYRSEYRMLVNKEKIKKYTSKDTLTGQEKALVTSEELLSSTEIDYSNLPVSAKYAKDIESIENGKEENAINNLPDIKETTNLSHKEIKNIKNRLLQKYKRANAERKTNGLAIAGFVISLVGLFIAGILLGTLAVVFGLISINKTGPDKPQKGKGFAIAAIVIGLIAVIGALIVLSTLHK